MATIIIILGLAVIIAVLRIRHQRKTEIEKMTISTELNDFLMIVYTTHDIKDMEWIYTLKAAILNNAMRVMDTTDMAIKMDKAINNQLALIADEMVRSGRK